MNRNLQHRLFNVVDYAPGVSSYHRAEGGAGGLPDPIDMSNREEPHRTFGYFEDFEYPAGSSEAVHGHGLESMERVVEGSVGSDATEQHLGKTLEGYESLNSRVNPNLSVEDLTWKAGSRMGHEGVRSEAVTPEGSVVGAVEWQLDIMNDVMVDTAEISPMYKGRGLSTPAIGSFMQHAAEGAGGRGIYAEDYTDAGEGAFHRKGVPVRQHGRIVEDVDPEAQRKKFLSPQQFQGVGFTDQPLPGIGEHADRENLKRGAGLFDL